MKIEQLLSEYHAAIRDAFLTASDDIGREQAQAIINKVSQLQQDNDRLRELLHDANCRVRVKETLIAKLRNEQVSK